jgi:hypothetical protein
MTAASRGPSAWARVAAGMAAWLSVPQHGQIRAWPYQAQGDTEKAALHRQEAQ